MLALGGPVEIIVFRAGAALLKQKSTRPSYCNGSKATRPFKLHAQAPTRAAYAGGSCEVTNSAVELGSGEMLVEATVRLLREMTPKQSSSRNIKMNGTKARCIFRGALVQNGTEPLAKGRKMHKIVEYRKVEGNVACDVT